MSDELRVRRAALLEELHSVERALAGEGSTVSGVTEGLSDSGGASEQLIVLRREQELLAQSEARFRAMIEYAPEAIAILDVDLGRFIEVNDNACRLFAMKRDALLQKSPLMMSSEIQLDGRPAEQGVAEQVARALEGEQVVFEWMHINANGEPIPTEVRLVRLPSADRRLLRGSIFDITSRRHAEQERERLTSELFQAQKMQAVGQLTGGVAHDFNNLLTVMTSSIELICMDAARETQVLLYAKQAMEATKRAAGLTQRLLAFARRQPLRPQLVSINKLVAGTEGLLRRTLGEDVAIETVLGGGLWHCEADTVQLENVVLNLAINARDAMPGGGRLTIETANARLDREYALAHDEVEAGQYVMLAVTDNGTGMADSVRKHVFEPFFTTKSAGRGSGLGLSMIYGFVKQSGGHINIYSELGEGTTVRVYLPRSSASRPADESRTPSEQTPRGDGRHLLVVEDEPGVREVVVTMLERMGYRTTHAGDAQEAMAALSAAPDIALVVTDVVLPGGTNGARLARKAQALRPGLRVLFMSGYTENAIIHNGRLDPGVSLLEKPFSQRELAMAVREVIEGDVPA